MKGKKKTPLTAALINITMTLFLFTAAVILLAYIMTKNDIAPSVYKTVYIIICGFIALVMSFLNGKGVKIKPVVMLAVSFAFSTLLSVLPVIAVSDFLCLFCREFVLRHLLSELPPAEKYKKGPDYK